MSNIKKQTKKNKNILYLFVGAGKPLIKIFRANNFVKVKKIKSK